MIPFIRDFFHDLFADEAFFRRLTPFLPLWWHKVAVISSAGVAGVLGGLIAAGQMNSKP